MPSREAQARARRSASPPPSAITLDGVSKTFAAGTVALRDFSLTVGAGEFVSLIGPSGCGKSTALRLIAGLTEPTTGTVERPDQGTDRPAGGIGFVFQDPTLMPWATVAGNVALPLKLARRPRAEIAERVEEALERVGLADFARAHPRTLSGGMRMRVSIARALVTRPRLLLMDEPFAALDEITRFRLNDELLALWQAQDWTVVFVTHSVYEAVFLSSRVLVLTPRPGRVATEIPVAAPYPREPDFRDSSLYARACREVSAALAATMAEAMT